jgi:hypothetical protein
MTEQRRWVVRIALNPADSQSMRAIIDSYVHHGTAVVHRDDERGACFDLLPPDWAGDNTQRWAEGLSRMMRDLVFNAVAAHEWADEAERGQGE